MITKFLNFVREKLDVSNFDSNKIYFLKNPHSDYEYLIVMNNDNLSGFITRGFQDDKMIKNNINTIGTVWGPSVGDILYGALIKKYGKIVPSRNISDQAKISWAKKIKDGDYTIRKIKGIGFYSAYKEERILNNIFDLKKEIKDKIIINDGQTLKNFEKICIEVKKKHEYMTKDFMEDKEKNYTFGESRDRFEWLCKNNAQSNVYKTYLTKEPRDFFINYDIPFSYPNNENADKYLSLI